MPSRSHSGARKRAATAAERETRRRILDALYARLRHAPAQPVSVEQVARDACVSRSTVYLIFGSRGGLFDALGTDLLQPAGFQRVVKAVAHPDAREHLRDGLRAGVEWFAAHRDVARALYSMTLVDPEAMGGAVQRWEENRAGGMDYLARRLAEQGILRPDVTTKEAADLLWLLASFDSFDQLYTGRGLPVDDVARVLITAAERSLCR